ncbi:MAG: hypothetical protein ACOCZB_04725 [Spirochaetota bacterium]
MSERGDRAIPGAGSSATIAVILLGCLLLVAGSGLQTTLIGVRTVTEGFDAVSTGVLMASFSLGYAREISSPKYRGEPIGRSATSTRRSRTRETRPTSASFAATRPCVGAS